MKRALRLATLLPVFASLASTACSSAKADPSDGGGGATPPGADAGTSGPPADGGGSDGGGSDGASTTDAGGSTDLTLVDCKTNTTDPKCPRALTPSDLMGKGPRLNLGHTLGGYVDGTKLVKTRT